MENHIFERIFIQTTGCQFKLLWCILYHFKKNEFTVTDLSYKAGMSESSIYKSLCQLVKMGFIFEIKPPTRHKRGGAIYKINDILGDSARMAFSQGG